MNVALVRVIEEENNLALGGGSLFDGWRNK
jgi:hypothetical protein